jgi:hypothetical protein
MQDHDGMVLLPDPITGEIQLGSRSPSAREYVRKFLTMQAGFP